MKKRLIIFILLLTLGIPNIVFSSEQIRIVTNGQEVKLTTVPVNEDKIIWVPLRSVFESLGAQVEWQPMDNSILITGNGKKIWLQINNRCAKIDEKEVQLDAPVKTVNGSSIIPLSFIAEVFPVKIDVDTENSIISINDFNCGTTLTAKSYILVEPKSGLILVDHNSHEKLKAGSVNKVMNLLLIFEALENKSISLESTVTASKQAAGTGGSQIFLTTGEKQSVDTLTRSMAMIGANDAAVAMAEYISGSEEAFVDLMNKKAEILGLKDTHFMNATGLDAEKQFTSAYDIAVVTRELITKYPEILEFSSVKNMIIKKNGQSGEVRFNLANSNKLLDSYHGATGLKTGYTAEAGYCIVGSAEHSGFQLIAVVLGASNSTARYNETAALLDCGFEKYDVLGGNDSTD